MEILTTNLENIARVHKGNAEYGAYGPGDVPVYGPDGVIDHVSGSQAEGPAIIVPGRNDGGSRIYYIAEAGPFYCTDSVYYITVKHDRVHPKFLYYWLKSLHLEQGPEITEHSLYALNPPIPPREEQTKIVAAVDADPSRLDADMTALGKPDTWIPNWLQEE